MKKVKPLGNRVLIERSKPQTTTKGGLFLPDSAKEKPREGTVVAVGPGKMDENGALEPMNVKMGDRVFFSSYSGTEVNCEGESEHLIMSEDDILGVLVT